MNLPLAQPKPIKNYRWRIVALLFFATTVNYIDRNVLSFTMLDEGFRKTMLGLPGDAELSQADINHFKELMGYVDAAFKTAYALGFLVVGWFIDKVGTRTGFTWSIMVWSLAGVANAFVAIRALGFTRFMLGIGEAGNFPSAIKSVAEWFPKKERAFATGILNAGANVGVIATAFAVPYLTLHYGWRASFVITGMLGVVLVLFWLKNYYRPGAHQRISKEEMDYIHSDQDEPVNQNQKISWLKLLTYKQTWALATCKFMADPIWYFYLTWLPDFFNSNEALTEKLDLKNIGIPFLVIYLVSDVGSIFFGWLSSTLLGMGWAVGNARKNNHAHLCTLRGPIFFASITHNIYVAVALIALATAAHQGWSGNVYTMGPDMFPKSTVSSVIGIGGMFGAVGGILLASTAGLIRVKYGYLPLFIMASVNYLIALGIVQWLIPKWQRISLPDETPIPSPKF